MTATRDTLARPDAGMSLTEVLVAVFIMALAAGMMVMTMRPKDDPLEEAATRLSHDIAAALDTALVTGTPQGLRLNETGYERLAWQDMSWGPSGAPAVVLKRTVTLNAPPARSRTPSLTPPLPTTAPTPPDIVLDETGTVESKPVILLHGRDRITLTIAPNGDVTWEAPNA